MPTVLEQSGYRSRPQAQGGRHHAGQARRHGQGDRPRQVRRRPDPAGNAGGQDFAQPAPARDLEIDRHLGGRGAARREGGGDARRLSRASPPARRSAIFSRNVMAREKVLYDGHAVAAVAATSESIAKKALKLIDGRVRGAAARHRSGRGDAGRMRPSCTTICAPRGWRAPRQAHQRRRAPRTQRSATWRRDSSRPKSSSNASSGPGRFTRAISSRRRASPTVPRTARRSCGAAPRGISSCATQVSCILKIDSSKMRVTPSELGGGFGGKTTSLCRAGGGTAVAQGQPAGEDRADAGRGVPRHRPGRGDPIAG